MICVGTAITPMYQAICKLLESPGETTSVTLLYGNISPADILMKSKLDEFKTKYPDRFKCTYVVDSGENWEGETGRINKDLIVKYFPPARSDHLVCVCGLPVIYEIFCGPRNEPELKPGTILHELGFTDSMVAKF